MPCEAGGHRTCAQRVRVRVWHVRMDMDMDMDTDMDMDMGWGSGWGRGRMRGMDDAAGGRQRWQLWTCRGWNRAGGCPPRSRSRVAPREPPASAQGRPRACLEIHVAQDYLDI